MVSEDSQILPSACIWTPLPTGAVRPAAGLLVFPGVVSRPQASCSSHPLPFTLALARAGAQGVLVMNKGRTRSEWGVFDKPDAFIGSCQQFC